MKLGGIVSSLMERVSLRHFNVGGKCCEGNSSSSYFFFFSSEMFHKLAGHRSHREMPSRLKDIYLLVNGRQTLFFPAFLGNTRKKKYIYRAINNLSGLTRGNGIKLFLLLISNSF